MVSPRNNLKEHLNRFYAENFSSSPLASQASEIK